MYRVKLIKGLSYTGSVCVTKYSPYADVEEKEAADALVASGYFEYVDGEFEPDLADDEPGATPPDEDGENAPVELNKLTVPQLTEYAAQLGVDLAGKTKKADIIAAIDAFAASTAPADGTASPDYGENE